MVTNDMGCGPSRVVDDGGDDRPTRRVEDNERSGTYIPMPTDSDIIVNLNNGQQKMGQYLQELTARMNPYMRENRLDQLLPRNFIRANALVENASLLSAPVRNTQTTYVPQTISFSKCRSCADNFEYSLNGSGEVTIFAGLPDSRPYTAFSYVWGEANPQKILCSGCGIITIAPLSSLEKLHQLMCSVDAGSTVWLDCLSINQGDHSDIARQVAVMGTIYKNAKSVSVLLPTSDNTSYVALRALSDLSWRLLQQESGFLENEERQVTLGDGSTHSLAELCKLFFEGVKQLKDATDNSTYFQRAWTFQEWGLAQDLDIRLESDALQSLIGIKSVILDAAAMVSRYIIINNDLAKISTHIPRGEVSPKFHTVKQLFPHEDFLLSWEEIDDDEKRFQILSSSLGVDHYLGIRSTLAPREDNFRSRLFLMLNMLDHRKRKARFEADMVACWASMCNIEYDYRKDDVMAVALHKVITALRKKGIKIFNFHVNCLGAILTTDLKFLSNTGEHIQVNANNYATLAGAPAFTGRADTIKHLIDSLTQGYWQLPESNISMQVGVQRVPGTVVKHSNCANGPEFMQGFGMVTYGQAVNPTRVNFEPVLESVAESWSAFRAYTPQLLQNNALFIAEIPVLQAGQNCTERKMYAWAVCSSRDASWTYFVGRESLNGSLVLFSEREGLVFPLGYLTVTDQLCGTFLVITNPNGLCEINLKTPLRGDSYHTDHVSDRLIRCTIPLAAEGGFFFEYRYYGFAYI